MQTILSPSPVLRYQQKRLVVLVGSERIFFCLTLPFSLSSWWGASLPGIVTYCHAAPAPHSRTAPPPIGARPLCKYCVTARAPACSRQGPITPATTPSHRLVKIVHFPSFLFLSFLSLFVLRLHSLLLFFFSLCFFIIPSIFPVSLFYLSPFLSFSLSACRESGRALHAVYSTDTCHICPLPNSPHPNSPLPINTFGFCRFLIVVLVFLARSIRGLSSWVSSRTFSTTPSTPTNCGQYYNGWYWLLTSSALVPVLMDE